MMEILEALVPLLFGGFLVVLGFSMGTIAEKRHYLSIRRREEELRDIMVFAVRTPPPSAAHCETRLVMGSVVVGMDYFKRALAMVKGIFGGRLGSYETLIDRARREAILRMKEEARNLGAGYVINIKFSTATVMSGTRENKGSGCVELVAYGTAVIPAHNR